MDEYIEDKVLILKLRANTLRHRLQRNYNLWVIMLLIINLQLCS